MSYRTVEVELENGRVHPSGADSLPSKAHALLTIISASPASEPSECEGQSLADLLADCRGIGNGKYTDLSTNKAHLDDLGR